MGLISFGIVVVGIVCKGFFIVEVCIVRVNLIYLHMYKMVQKILVLTHLLLDETVVICALQRYL